MSEPEPVAPLDWELLLVDGLNLLGARPDGWWRDRPAAMAKLTRRLRELAAETGVEIAVVFDGNSHRRVAAGGGGGVEVEFAPGGPNAADRVIAARVREHPRPEAVLVVSSDRRLQASVKAAGGARVGAGEFARRWLYPDQGGSAQDGDQAG